MALRKPLFMSAEGYSEEMASADSIELGALTMSGNIVMATNKITGLGAATASGDALSYGQSGALLNGLDVNSQKITNLLTPTAATDAATKGYVDGLAQGLDVHGSVRLLTDSDITLSGTQTLDGVAAVVGNRVLTAGQTDPTENGIWVVAAGAWTRATDLAAGASGAGAFMFVEEGTSYADTGWVCTSDVGSDVVGTDSLAFTQFSSAGVIVAGTGLTKTSNTIDFIGGKGILANADSADVELDTAADAQGAGNGGGSSGLEFDTSGDAGKLRAAVNATAGLERTASGLGVLLNGTTLQSGASGLSVKGLPSLFEIATVAVSANVTAANLGTLTGGGDASALHTHLGVTNAKKIYNTDLSNEALAIGDPVVWSGTALKLNQAQASADARARVVGVNLTTAGGADVSVDWVAVGVAPGVLSGATPGAPYYLGDSGGLSASTASGGNRNVLVGYAKSATDLWVRITDYGKKAA